MQLSNRQVRTLLLKADAHKVLPSVLRHYPFSASDPTLERIRQEADSRRIESAALSTMLRHHTGLILEAASDLPVELVKGPCACRKSNPLISVMQSTQDRTAEYETNGLYGA